MKLLFLGDSLVEFYDWQARFPGHAVINAGMAGETTAGLLARLPSHLRRCPAPDRIFIMIGANNLLREEYAFLPEYGKMLDTLDDAAPAAGITVTSLPPMRIAHLAPSAIPRINQGLLLLSLKKRAGFLDLFAAFSAGNRDAAACFAEDGVHLSALGYEIWSASLARTLK